MTSKNVPTPTDAQVVRPHKRIAPGSRSCAPVQGSGSRLLPADRDRVMEALEQAAHAAEQGQPVGSVLLVRKEDLADLDPEDLRSGLDRVMLGAHADLGLDTLLTTGLLDALLPEVQALVGFGDGEWRHKDVWKHTKQVVVQAEQRLEIRWSALFHDIGKVRTRSVATNGDVHFFGHAEVGARMFDKLERRQGLFATDAALRKEIRFLVLHHLRASQYDGKWTDSAVRRFAREMGPYLDDLLCLSRADITTKRPEKKRRGVSMINQLAERIGVLATEDAKVAPLPKGVGDELMAAFGLSPSKLVGDIKRALEAAVDQGEIQAGQPSGYYVQFVAEHRGRFGLS